jgi:hypothetical protein
MKKEYQATILTPSNKKDYISIFANNIEEGTKKLKKKISDMHPNNYGWLEKSEYIETLLVKEVFYHIIEIKEY